MDEPRTAPHRQTKAQEIGTLLVLAGVIAPLIAVVVVAGYGFVVWMSQLLLGPPNA
jgi:nitrate reductase NapE